jgi:hypothetical protein
MSTKSLKALKGEFEASRALLRTEPDNEEYLEQYKKARKRLKKVEAQLLDSTKQRREKLVKKNPKKKKNKFVADEAEESDAMDVIAEEATSSDDDDDDDYDGEAEEASVASSAEEEEEDDDDDDDEDEDVAPPKKKARSTNGAVAAKKPEVKKTKKAKKAADTESDSSDSEESDGTSAVTKKKKQDDHKKLKEKLQKKKEQKEKKMKKAAKIARVLGNSDDEDEFKYLYSPITRPKDAAVPKKSGGLFDDAEDDDDDGDVEVEGAAKSKPKKASDYTLDEIDEAWEEADKDAEEKKKPKAPSAAAPAVANKGRGARLPDSEPNIVAVAPDYEKKNAAKKRKRNADDDAAGEQKEEKKKTVAYDPHVLVFQPLVAKNGVTVFPNQWYQNRKTGGVRKGLGFVPIMTPVGFVDLADEKVQQQIKRFINATIPMDEENKRATRQASGNVSISSECVVPKFVLELAREAMDHKMMTRDHPPQMRLRYMVFQSYSRDEFIDLSEAIGTNVQDGFVITLRNGSPAHHWRAQYASYSATKDAQQVFAQAPLMLMYHLKPVQGTPDRDDVAHIWSLMPFLRNRANLVDPSEPPSLGLGMHPLQPETEPRCWTGIAIYLVQSESSSASNGAAAKKKKKAPAANGKKSTAANDKKSEEKKKAKDTKKTAEKKDKKPEKAEKVEKKEISSKKPKKSEDADDAEEPDALDAADAAVTVEPKPQKKEVPPAVVIPPPAPTPKAATAAPAPAPQSNMDISPDNWMGVVSPMELPSSPLVTPVSSSSSSSSSSAGVTPTPVVADTPAPVTVETPHTNGVAAPTAAEDKTNNNGGEDETLDVIRHGLAAFNVKTAVQRICEENWSLDIAKIFLTFPEKDSDKENVTNSFNAMLRTLGLDSNRRMTVYQPAPDDDGKPAAPYVLVASKVPGHYLILAVPVPLAARLFAAKELEDANIQVDKKSEALNASKFRMHVMFLPKHEASATMVQKIRNNSKTYQGIKVVDKPNPR